MTKSISTGVVALQYVTEGKKRQSRELRQNMTPAEACLWEHLRNRKLHGLKFRRQQIINGFVADFFCEELRLVVEVDGEVHDTEEQKEIDARRTEVFTGRGLREVRFKNEEVLKQTQTVLMRIASLRTEAS